MHVQHATVNHHHPPQSRDRPLHPINYDLRFACYCQVQVLPFPDQKQDVIPNAKYGRESDLMFQRLMIYQDGRLNRYYEKIWLKDLQTALDAYKLKPV